MNVLIIFFVVSISPKAFRTPVKYKNAKLAKVSSSVFLMSRRTVVYEKIQISLVSV